MLPYKGAFSWTSILAFTVFYWQIGLAESFSLVHDPKQCIRDASISVTGAFVDVYLEQGVAYYKVEYQSDIESFIDIEVSVSVLGIKVAPKQKIDPCAFTGDGSTLSQALCPIRRSDTTYLEGQLIFDPSIVPINTHDLLKSDLKVKFVAFEASKQSDLEENYLNGGWIPPWKRIRAKRRKVACFLLYSKDNKSPEHHGGIGQLIKHLIPGWGV